MPSDKIKMLTYVPVLEQSKKTYLNEEPADGYQRPGSAVRMRAFGEYVQENPLAVVPPIILSARGKWPFNEEDGSLHVEAPATIIDGQHRAGGYAYLFEKDGIPRSVEFFLLPDLEREQETDEFLTINTTQKGVPKSLGVLLEANDDALVAEELRTRDDSPFKDRITRVVKKKGELFSLAAVARNVGRTFRHGAFEGVGLDEKVEIVLEYWTKIADAFPEEWQDIDRTQQDQQFKLLETTGLIAWSLAADDILGPAFDPETKTMNWDRVEASLGKISTPGALDWLKDGEFQGLTGEVGGARIHKKMQLLLARGAALPPSPLDLEEAEG
jgi:DNA sulfur modification protein DndB